VNITVLFLINHPSGGGGSMCTVTAVQYGDNMSAWTNGLILKTRYIDAESNAVFIIPCVFFCVVYTENGWEFLNRVHQLYISIKTAKSKTFNWNFAIVQYRDDIWKRKKCHNGSTIIGQYILKLWKSLFSFLFSSLYRAVSTTFITKKVILISITITASFFSQKKTVMDNNNTLFAFVYILYI